MSETGAIDDIRLLADSSVLVSAACLSPSLTSESPFAVPFMCELERSFLMATSSILTWRPSWSLSFLVVRSSPSCFAILAFISARSMSQAFRARS